MKSLKARQKLALHQAAGGQVNLPTLHMMGETDKVGFQNQTKPCHLDFSIIILKGDREGNE